MLQPLVRSKGKIVSGIPLHRWWSSFFQVAVGLFSSTKRQLADLRATQLPAFIRS